LGGFLGHVRGGRDLFDLNVPAGLADNVLNVAVDVTRQDRKPPRLRAHRRVLLTVSSVDAARVGTLALARPRRAPRVVTGAGHLTGKGMLTADGYIGSCQTSRCLQD